MIQRHGDYLLDRDLQGRVLIGIESDRLEACISEACRIGAQGVFGSPAFKFQERHLDFLSRLPQLEKIWFWDVSLVDIEGIYSLRSLRHFGIHPDRPAIDFGRLPELEHVVWQYNPRDSGLATLLHLSALHIWHCNLKGRTFQGLDLPHTLSELEISWASVRSLEGLPEMPRLTRLGIHRCRNLESLEELPRIAPNLEHLVVAACGRVADGEHVVRRLPKIKHAFVRDALLVGEQPGT